MVKPQTNGEKKENIRNQIQFTIPFTKSKKKEANNTYSIPFSLPPSLFPSLIFNHERSSHILQWKSFNIVGLRTRLKLICLAAPNKREFVGSHVARWRTLSYDKRDFSLKKRGISCLLNVAEFKHTYKTHKDLARFTKMCRRKCIFWRKEWNIQRNIHLFENVPDFIRSRTIEKKNQKKKKRKNANPTSITVNFFPFVSTVYHLMIFQPQISKVIIN